MMSKLSKSTKLLPSLALALALPPAAAPAVYPAMEGGVVKIIVEKPDGNDTGAGLSSLQVQPRRLAQLVETVDVLPTVFDSLGLPIPRCFEGESFWPLISGASRKAPHDSVIIATNRRDKHAIRSGYEKYIVWTDGTEELYDLAADPDEQDNIAKQRPERAAALRRQLEAVVDLAATDSLPSGNQLRDDPEMNRLLETLGYLEKDDPKPHEGRQTPQPRVCSD